MNIKLKIIGVFGAATFIGTDDNPNIAAVHGADTEEGRERAAFIVRACNSHDALIMVLEAIMDEGKTDYIYEIQQALALANGGESP